MSKLLLILALAVTVPLSKAVTNNETSSRMDQEMPQLLDDQGNYTPLFELDNVLKECNKSFMIESSFMEDLEKSGSFADETEKTPKCYVRCLLDLTGVTDLEEGKYDPEQAALLFSVQTNEETQKDDVEEIAKACMEDRAESCPCERAYEFVKCIRQMEIQKYGSEI